MKNMKKLIALALVAISILTVTIQAFANPITLYVAPGKNPRTVGYEFDDGFASFDCDCTLAGSGDTVRVFLDTFNIARNDWILRKSHKFTSDGSITLTYNLGNTESKARIRTYGYKENSGTATVVVTVNN